jgi:hypothetical protein
MQVASDDNDSTRKMMIRALVCMHPSLAMGGMEVCSG